MGATQVVEPEAGPRRASAALAVGTMAAIALLVAAAVVAWARFGGATTTVPESQVIDAGPPESLADGSPPGPVPEAVAAAVEGPVVAAVRMDSLPADLEGCDTNFALDDGRLESAIITPDAAVVAMVGSSEEFGFGPGPVPLPAPLPLPAPVPEALPPPEASALPEASPAAAGPAPAAAPIPVAPPPARLEPERDRPQARASCAASWEGAWALTMVNAAPVGQIFGSSGTGLADGTALSITPLLVPEGAAWLVHDRGGYRLAYPVTGLPVVDVTVPQPESGVFGTGVSSTPAVFLDDAGTLIEETFVGG